MYSFRVIFDKFELLTSGKSATTCLMCGGKCRTDFTFQQRKNSENPLTFDEVTINDLGGLVFMGHSVDTG